MKSTLDDRPNNSAQKKMTFTIDHERKIMHEIISGYINLTDLIKFKQEELASPEFNPFYSIITDIQQVDFNFSEGGISNIIRFFKHDFTNYLSFQKCALVTSKPKQVVVSKLFELRMADFFPGKLRIFSTYETALSWIEAV